MFALPRSRYQNCITRGLCPAETSEIDGVSAGSPYLQGTLRWMEGTFTQGTPAPVHYTDRNSAEWVLADSIPADGKVYATAALASDSVNTYSIQIPTITAPGSIAEPSTVTTLRAQIDAFAGVAGGSVVTHPDRASASSFTPYVAAVTAAALIGAGFVAYKLLGE